MNGEINIDTDEGMDFAVQWQTNLMNNMRQGATWGIPRIPTIYTVYPKDKIAVREVPDEAVDRVFIKMGWIVREEY